ncbi:MAG TPA: hypothetical protein VHT91_47740 [Kofleriaceae bacterium]|jgi:hypothetical protein|nr:hypothetical protein [Kofleriaceae bacterium]
MKRLLLVAVVVAACQPAGAGTPTTRPAPPPRIHLLNDLVGGWRWLLHTAEDGTTRVESETWRLWPTLGVPTQLTGRYLREVEVRADDRVPFACNQRPWYRQRTVYDVTVQTAPSGFTVRETGYRTEPSPCDHGFRHLESYAGDADGERFTLHWDGGDQTLWQVDSEVAELPAVAWPPGPEITGPWRWDATSYDDAGNLRDESEWWEITRRNDRELDLSYRRRVTVRSPDGADIACAGGPAWSFDDAYLLDGEREDEHWHFHERAYSPGEHPCLAAYPRRSLDEATAEQLGDFLVLEWRGKRHQVLYRPD